MFPPVEQADSDGLLAIGGDLSIETLLTAYRSGIFPWFSKGEPIMWWSPDPRFVLLPGNLIVSTSMEKILKRGEFEIRYNTAFEEVIRHCSKIKRKGHRGTWITEEMINAYIDFHKAGYAMSGEAWKDGKLVGGFYGVKLGKCFFGESMFSKVSNASKAAFISFAREFFENGGVLIDCQVYTEHLATLGAEMIPRPNFVKMIG